MKAISLWQPWASLWLTAAKRYETRGWPANHSGPLLVHAAKKVVRASDLDAQLLSICTAFLGYHWESQLPRGALLGYVILLGSHQTEKLRANGSVPMLSMEDRCGNFSPGRWGWERGAQIFTFKNPPAWTGRQRFFDVPDNYVRSLAKVMSHV